MVEAWLAEMWETDRSRRGLKPVGHRCIMPDGPPNRGDIQDSDDDDDQPDGPPSAAAIDRFDRCSRWHLWLDDVRDQRIVLAITAGISARRVAKRDGRDRALIQLRYRKGLSPKYR